MSNNMELYISSGSHLDDIESRIRKIEQALEEPDVVFAEGGEPIGNLEQLKLIIILFPRVPLFATAIFSYIYILLGVFGWLISNITGGEKGSDKEIARKIASRYDIEIEEVDQAPLYQPVYDYPVTWFVFSWGAVIVAAYLFFPGFHIGIEVIGFIFVLLLVGYIHIAIMIIQSNKSREKVMTEIVTSESDSYDSACLIIGEGHHPGVGSKLETVSSVNVINPYPKNMNVLARIVLNILD